MLDASLPLTPPEWPEWGNPITSEDDYKVIADYAPYENIQALCLSAYFGDRRIDRPTGDLLGAGKMGGSVARYAQTRV